MTPTLLRQGFDTASASTRRNFELSKFRKVSKTIKAEIISCTQTDTRNLAQSPSHFTASPPCSTEPLRYPVHGREDCRRLNPQWLMEFRRLQSPSNFAATSPVRLRPRLRSGQQNNINFVGPPFSGYNRRDVSRATARACRASLFVISAFPPLCQSHSSVVTLSTTY